MNNIGQYNPPPEPDREPVESAIIEVLKIAQSRGIDVVGFIQMLDSGMQISDFLNAMDGFTNADYASLRDRSIKDSKYRSPDGPNRMRFED